MRKVPCITTYIYFKPSIDSVFKAIEKSRIEQKQYEEYITKNKYRNLSEKEYQNTSDNINTILNKNDEIIQLIVGISVQKSGFFKNIGAHAFIMYNVDPYNSARKWQNDIMLDASGSYGKKKFRNAYTDVIYYYSSENPEKFSPTTISIDSYRRYFLMVN